MTIYLEKKILIMNRKIIRLTESDLHWIVRESVSKLLSEAMSDGMSLSSRQVRNMTGIHDDDELNAACDSEECGDLASGIARDLCGHYGYYGLYDKGSVFDFGFLSDLLKEKYGMEFLGYDEDDESHLFGNDRFLVTFWTMEGFPNLNKFHLSNMDVSLR